MEKTKNEMSSSKKEITVTLSLSDDFICTCELMNISYCAALEQYLKHIKIYNYFFNEKEGANVEATALFKKFEASHLKKHGLQVAKHHQLHLAPIKEILRLGTEHKGSKSTEYTNVIKTWHETISERL